MRDVLTKVCQQLARTAQVVGSGIVQHGMDALPVLLTSFFINVRRDDDVFRVLASLHIPDGRDVTTRYEVKQTAL